MAYSSAPEKQTYSTERVPAAYDMDLRPNSVFYSGTTTYQDAGMINLLPIKVKNPITKQDEIHAVTRQPIHAYEVVNSDLINRGCYVWEKSVGTTYYFVVCGTGVYSSADGASFSLVDTLTTSATTPVRFTEFISSTSTKSLVLVDGVEGYVYTSNAAGTKITDGDFPTPHIPFPVFLDGYLFLAKASTGDIYNSNLDSPSAWTAGSFISSEMYPDDLQALVKINNYILAIGTQGSEFFYDAANPTASPLARYDGGSLPVGTQIPNSIASNKNAVVFISNTSDGENSVTVIEDFKSKTIGSSFLIPALNTRLTAASNNTTAAAVRGFFFRQYGQMFYGLTFQGNTAAPNLLNPTFVFSFETGWWSEFRYGSSGTAPFPVYFTTQSTSDKLTQYVSGHVGNTPFFGILEEGAKTPFSATAEDHIVNGPAVTTIYTELRTPNLDFGTRNRKTISRFGVGATENSSSTTTSGATVTVAVSWSDDDYSTWSTARDLIFGGALQFPFITQLGMFVQRAFKLTYASTKFLRYKELEMDINKGQQ
jgi:hypothetical protein